MNMPATSSGGGYDQSDRRHRAQMGNRPSQQQGTSRHQGDAAPVPGAVRARRDRRNRAARGWAFGLLIALLVQFGLGMYVNLFAYIPLNHPGHGANDFFAGSYHSVAWAETSPHAPLTLAFDAGLGLLLVLGSLWLAVLAIGGRRAGFVWAAVLGALFILGAGFNGSSFLNYNHDANSYRDGAAVRRRRPVLHHHPGAARQHRTSSPSGLTVSPINRYLGGIVGTPAD